MFFYSSVTSYSTWCDGHPVAIDNRTLLFLLLRRLQAGALLHVADWLVPLSLALGAWPGSGQQGLTHIQRRGCRGRLRWRFRSAVEVIWGQTDTAQLVLEATCTFSGDVTHSLAGSAEVHRLWADLALKQTVAFQHITHSCLSRVQSFLCAGIMTGLWIHFLLSPGT